VSGSEFRRATLQRKTDRAVSPEDCLGFSEDVSLLHAGRPTRGRPLQNQGQEGGPGEVRTSLGKKLADYRDQLPALESKNAIATAVVLCC